MLRRTRAPSRGNTCATSCLHTQPPLPERSYTPEEEVYLRTHAQRYEFLVDLVTGLAPQRILVVGPSFESALLRKFLAGGLSPGGGIVIQTPNATALPKRLRMLIGRNPYEPIRSTPKNPGHFHEYTVGELRLALDEAGFEITRLVTANYFAHGSRQNRAFRALGRAVPRSLRGGITVVARPRP